MLELLNVLISFVWGLVVQVWGLLMLVVTFAWDMLYHLHVSAPRLEGLLVGVALAWLVARRDRHPLLRVLSSPMKLVIDILDLAWDQLDELISDLWTVCVDWVRRPVNAVRGWVSSLWDRGMGALRGLKSRLSKDSKE